MALSRFDLLPADTAMGAVTLYADDLDLVTRFYRDAVGLEEISHGIGAITLGRDGIPAMILEHRPELSRAAQGSAGLFHTALLFPTQQTLAQAVYRVATHFPGSFTGSADHLVSEAFYFDDPEGNGVELYWDRPRELWQRRGTEILMDTLPLPPQEFLSVHLGDAEVEPSGLGVGHVHLQVGDVEQARDFYVHTLGFEPTFMFGNQALFVSAGGYHHHMAMNTWRSRGAGWRSPTLGLGRVTIDLPDSNALDQVRSRLRDRGFQSADDGLSVSVADPWGNSVVLTTASS